MAIFIPRYATFVGKNWMENLTSMMLSMPQSAKAGKLGRTSTMNGKMSVAIAGKWRSRIIEKSLNYLSIVIIEKFYSLNFF